MFLSGLRMSNFKNFTEKNFSFSEKINCVVGNNGIGKTNVLDAIHYLCLTKSYLNHSDVNNIRFEEEFFNIEGNFKEENQDNIILLAVQTGQKKMLKRNAKNYDRLSDHIGRYPCVMISPYDHNLIAEGSDLRRKFLDSMISQINPEYLQYLIRYQKAVNQRNALLKMFAVQNYFDPISLEIYDYELVSNGNEIFRIRNEFMENFIPEFVKYYNLIAQNEERVSISYLSDLKSENFETLLKQNLSKDRVATYTTTGVHKDDLLFLLHGYPIKKVGSQGQQKSFLVALKLAQMLIIKQNTKKNPILLLDDIFDKLDENRVSQLVKLVHEQEFGQIFLTDTHLERTEKIVQQISKDYKVFNLSEN